MIQKIPLIQTKYFYGIQYPVIDLGVIVQPFKSGSCSPRYCAFKLSAWQVLASKQKKKLWKDYYFTEAMGRLENQAQKMLEANRVQASQEDSQGHSLGISSLDCHFRILTVTALYSGDMHATFLPRVWDNRYLGLSFSSYQKLYIF